MANTPTAFVRALLNTVGTPSDYTVGSGATAIVTNIVLANETASAVAATVLLDGIDLIPGLSVPANTAVTYDCRQVVAATKVIRAYAASNSAINCHISGVVVT